MSFTGLLHWWKLLSKLVQASLGVRKDVERRFQHYGGSLKLLYANLSVYRYLKGSFHFSGGLVKLWNGIFSARKNLEISFDHYGCPVKLVHASLGTRKGKEKNV